MSEKRMREARREFFRMMVARGKAAPKREYVFTTGVTVVSPMRAMFRRFKRALQRHKTPLAKIAGSLG